MDSRSRALIRSACLFLAFFASGASSLIAEVTWNRMLIVVVGNSLAAAAMIVSVFMGGLGLGSWVGGRVLGRRKPSLVPYVLLELTIGVYVLLSPALFGLLSGVFESLAESTADRGMLSFVRVAVSLAALLFPAFLMGATFPAIISSAVSGSAARRTARTGYLYSVNTLGAALGCFAAGYHLLLEIGVRSTLAVAFGLYVAAALFAGVAALVGRATPAAADPPTPVAVAPPTRHLAGDPLRRFLYVATFGIGFVVLAYEVLLTRLSILYLGNSVSVFPLVLTAFLLGTGISAVAGTWLYGKLSHREGGGNRLFGITAIAAAAFVLATPYALLADWLVSAGEHARFADATLRNPLPILGIIMAPTILIGALLPVAIRMLQARRRAEATREAATLYSLNTAGGLLGAGLANHFFVPLIGIRSTFVLLVAITVAIGIHALVPARRRLPRGAMTAIGVGALVILLAAGLPDMMEMYASKIAESTGAESTEVRLIYEGRAATVAVLDQVDPELGTYRDMYLNGVEEASTRYWHAQLFKLLGILPVLLHESEEEKEALVIAFGAGITAGSVLASDRVSTVDVVDLNPDIEGINDWFTDVNGDVFHEPRFRFQNDDGRNYLVTSGRRFDVIVGDSTHPRAYDSWILYTEEFYRAVAKHLKPGGIFAQWVPVLGSMQGELFRIHLNTFRTVFPHATVWYIYGSDQAFLLATPEPFVLDPERLQPKLDRLPDWFRADEYQIDTVARVAGFFWMDAEMMSRMIAGETRINTDDFHYFDKQSAVRPAPPQWRLPQFHASVLPYVEGADGALRSAIQAEQTVAGHMGRYGFFLTKPDLYRAYCLMPDNGNVQYWMARLFADQIPEHESFCRDEEIRAARATASSHPDNALALNDLAFLLAEAGTLDEALDFAERAVALTPGSGVVLDTYGWVLLQRGEPGKAVEAFEKAAVDLPEHPVVLYHLGIAYDAVGRGAESRRRLEQALEADEDFPGAADARMRLGRGD